MSINRRTFLAAGSAVALGSLSAPALVGKANAADKIKLGSLLDVSGLFDAYGKPMDMALRLAVDQINAGGGLLGREVEIVGYDTQSKVALYTQYAQKLIRRDKVDVVHGAILSAEREAIRQMLHKAKILYFYNVLYEGGVCDRNICIDGVTPAQQVEVLMPAAIKKWGKKIYILAADYNYGQITARWMKKYAQEAGGKVIQTDFFPLDVSDFGAAIAKVQAAAPDIVVCALVGGAHLSFFRQWAAAGMKAKIPMASTTLGVGNEYKVLTPEEGNGILVAYNYSPELKSPANEAFLKAWAGKYGDTRLIHEIAVSHYQGILLWAQALRNAKSIDRMKVIDAIEGGLSIEGPAGKVSIDPKTHHAILDVHLMEFENQKMKVLESFPQRQPVDTQAVCNLKTHPNDDKQYEIKV
jgi:branched-chain amino acid transport system substrate-binding protein